MSGLDEAVEAGVIPYLGHEPYDPEVRDSVKADVRAILLACAPALLLAVVAEMQDGEFGGAWAMGTGYWHDTRNIPQPSRGPESGASTGMCFPAAMRVNLEISLLAALSRLGRADPKEGV